MALVEIVPMDAINAKLLIAHTNVYFVSLGLNEQNMSDMECLNIVLQKNVKCLNS